MTRWSALAFAVGYGLVRLYWALGGRWGYTACDRTATPRPGGCGADTAALPFWSGWGAVLLCAVLVALVFVPKVGLWLGCAALVVLSFPGHLLFEVPAGLGGRTTDWRDVAHRVVLLGGGLLFGLAGPRPRSRWRPSARWAWVAAVLPVAGFSLPHALWFAGVPLGIPRSMLSEIRADLDVATILALILAPVVGGVLTLALTRPWGRRWFVVAPAAVVALALTAYGVLGVGLMSSALLAGTATVAELAAGWAVAATELVFLAWGVALGGAVWRRAAERWASDAAVRG